jgi:hypothetical protein
MNPFPPQEALAFFPGLELSLVGLERIVLMDVSERWLCVTFASGRKLVVYSEPGPSVVRSIAQTE